MKKRAVLLLASAFVITMFSGCAGKTEQASTTTTALTTTTVATTTTAAETTAPPETTTTTETQEEVSEYITTFADGKTSMECFTCEGEKGVWAHLINPYNEVSLFMPKSPKSMDADTENLVICFNVSGVKEEMAAFCGIMAYGLGEDDEELSVWNNDTYNALTGEDFEYVIDKDGYYEMTVPIAKLASGLDFWEGLSYASIVEVAFYGAEGLDDAGEYTKVLKDGLEFEFLGIRAE